MSKVTIFFLDGGCGCPIVLRSGLVERRVRFRLGCRNFKIEMSNFEKRGCNRLFVNSDPKIRTYDTSPLLLKGSIRLPLPFYLNWLYLYFIDTNIFKFSLLLLENIFLLLLFHWAQGPTAFVKICLSWEFQALIYFIFLYCLFCEFLSIVRSRVRVKAYSFQLRGINRLPVSFTRRLTASLHLPQSPFRGIRIELCFSCILFLDLLYHFHPSPPPNASLCLFVLYLITYFYVNDHVLH